MLDVAVDAGRVADYQQRQGIADPVVQRAAIRVDLPVLGAVPGPRIVGVPPRLPRRLVGELPGLVPDDPGGVVALVKREAAAAGESAG
jgi:hypothetical protein